MSVQGARIGQKKLYCKKVPENFQIRVDKTNYVWYSVLATRLDKSNHVAPEKRKPLQGLLRKPDPPWQSCGAVSGDPQVCRGEATPSCLRKTALWLKSPTGAFIAAQTPIPPFHSLFSSEPWFLFAPTARCAGFGVIGTAQSAQEKQKRDMQLDHLRAPIFVFNSFSHG